MHGESVHRIDLERHPSRIQTCDQRNAHTDLEVSAADRVCQHAIQAERREEHRDSGTDINRRVVLR